MINALLLTTLVSAQPAPPPLRVPPLVDLEGATRSVPATGAKATVVVFMTTDCPIANRMSPEIKRLSEEFASKGAVFYIAYVDPTVGLEETMRHFRARKFNAFAVFDERHQWVGAMRASKTPEAMVVDPAGNLLYRGRIDNTYQDHNRRRVSPTSRDLRDAIVAVLGGRRTPLPETTVVGCDIPRISR